MATIPYSSVVMSADHVAGPQQGQWTSEYDSSIPDDGVRYEIPAGILYMLPPPSDVDQFANNLIHTFFQSSALLPSIVVPRFPVAVEELFR